MTLLAYVFQKLRTVKDIDKFLKSLVSEHISTVNMLKGHKHCWNLHDDIFIIFVHYSEGNSVGKCLSQWYLKCDILVIYKAFKS